jgi:single-strand DNA-binding protein
MNNVYLLGRSGADAELRNLPNGTAIITISIAVNEKKADGTYIPHWFRVTAFGKTAEILGPRIKKGTEVMVQGRLVSRTWDDKNTGQKRNSVEVVAQYLRTTERFDTAMAPAVGNAGINTQLDNFDDIPF